MIRSQAEMWPACSMMLLQACFVFIIALYQIESAPVPITRLNVSNGAACLDGSPPAYHLEKGNGAGINNWIVHIEGGGWCEDVESCLLRKKTSKGSSSKMKSTIGFSGILSSLHKNNPDFFNWNRVKVKYCDGSSFTGNKTKVDVKNKLYFRGARIWDAVMNDLMQKGMKNAQNAILSGCSAGGLAAILHCDKFRYLFGPKVKVRCVSDAGFFIHGKDFSENFQIEHFFGNVVATHGSLQDLPSSCTSKMEKKELCFFPQYVIPTLNTSIFIANAAYDSWQIKNILAPSAIDRNKVWQKCKTNLTSCSPHQLQQVHWFRNQILNATIEAGLFNLSNGLFLYSCYTHCQAGTQATWLGDAAILVDNTKIGQAVGDWFYGRKNIHMMDNCTYPCNPSCNSVDSSD